MDQFLLTSFEEPYSCFFVDKQKVLKHHNSLKKKGFSNLISVCSVYRGSSEAKLFFFFFLNDFQIRG